MNQTKYSSPITYEDFQEKVKNLRTLGDVTEFAKFLIAPTLQTMLAQI